MRITTSMVQRNVLADLNSLSSQLAKTQAKAASNKEITRPADDPFKASQAMGLRSNLGANEQYLRTIQDSTGWMDSTESALDSIGGFVSRAHTLVLQASTDTSDANARKAIATELTQIIDGIKQSANASYGGKYIMAGTAIETPPYQMGANDAYAGDEAGLDPAIPGVVREIGPGVTMTINTVAREFLGDGQAAADNKLLHTLRNVLDHLNADDGPRCGPTARRWRATSTSCWASAPATARRPTGSRRRRRASTRSARPSRISSRTPRTRTSRRR
jgi:flagellar hook-associated protein 3 FlgL